jgi:hypothetical protein
LNSDVLTLGYVVFWLAVLALAPALLACSRLAILSFFSIFHRKTRPNSKPSAKIAVVLYARDEEFFIEKTVRGIIADTAYPAHLFEVVVVADNCRDSTAYIATFAGAKVLERSDMIAKGRSHALEWALAKLATEEYDAFLIADADTSIPPRTLALLDSALSKGALAIRLPMVVARADENWKTRLDDIGEATRECLLPRGVSTLGLSSGLTECGFCLAKSMLKEIPYQAFSESEYLVYHIELVLAGERVRLVRGAGLEARDPAPSAELERRREEMSKRRVNAVSKHAGSLLKAAAKGNLAAMECLVAVVAPSLSTLSTILSVTFLTGLLLSFGGVSMPKLEPLLDPALGLMAAAFAGFSALAAHVAVAMLERGLPISNWLALPLAPMYVLERALASRRKNGER